MVDLIDRFKLTLVSGNEEIARAIASYLILEQRQYQGHLPPYVMAIEHDAKKSKPPVKCDVMWGSGYCGMDFAGREDAAEWVIAAVMAGARVLRRFGSRVQTEAWGLESVRRVIAAREARLQGFSKSSKDMDDEIPF